MSLDNDFVQSKKISDKIQKQRNLWEEKHELNAYVRSSERIPFPEGTEG
jgi:hypothetical protein